MDKKFEVIMEITVSGRLVGEDTDCQFVENSIKEIFHSTDTEELTVEAKDIWAKEIHEEEGQ